MDKFITEQGFRVLKNIVRHAGQILLNPVATIPKQELWLWQNPSALAAVGRGIEQAAKQETYDLGSFAQYADLEVED